MDISDRAYDDLMQRIEGAEATVDRLGDELDGVRCLAGVLRKIVTAYALYFALYEGSACIDGWVDLTPEEVAAIRALNPDAWDMPSA